MGPAGPHFEQSWQLCYKERTLASRGQKIRGQAGTKIAKFTNATGNFVLLLAKSASALYSKARSSPNWGPAEIAVLARVENVVTVVISPK